MNTDKNKIGSKATLKYFYVAAVLLLQIGLGAVTAHYGVEGAGFYGIPLDPAGTPVPPATRSAPRRG